MSSKKKIAAIAITIAALTAGSAGVASAHDGAGKGQAKATVLVELVKAGTITQAQADAITKKFDEFRVTKDANKADHDARHAAVKALVASTLGIDAATIEARLVAGESLGAIAGAKKASLITALVAFETKEIDARVAAGKLTAAQATTMKTGLSDQITKKVESVKAPMGPKGPKGMGMGKGPKPPRP
jgi:Spy/CpxP family protein refolding chaperone